MFFIQGNSFISDLISSPIAALIFGGIITAIGFLVKRFFDNRDKASEDSVDLQKFNQETAMGLVKTINEQLQAVEKRLQITYKKKIKLKDSLLHYKAILMTIDGQVKRVRSSFKSIEKIIEVEKIIKPELTEELQVTSDLLTSIETTIAAVEEEEQKEIEKPDDKNSK